jgi:hypothetical protein
MFNPAGLYSSMFSDSTVLRNRRICCDASISAYHVQGEKALPYRNAKT